jgi:hypothetical protein
MSETNALSAEVSRIVSRWASTGEAVRPAVTRSGVTKHVLSVPPRLEDRSDQRCVAAELRTDEGWASCERIALPGLRR